MAETVLNQQEAKIETAADAKRQNGHLIRILGIVLSVVMIALSFYVYNLFKENNSVLFRSSELALTSSDRATANYRTYFGKYKETKIELDQTTKKLEQVNLQLNQVTAELMSTKGMLTQTQGMLAQAQEENTRLKHDLQGLDNLRSSENVQNINDLQTKIKGLRETNTQISSQLEGLKAQLRVFEADFSNLEEGRSLMALFQNKIRMVKRRMHELKEQAYQARVAAQKEKDRLGQLNGNDGFVLKNGKLQTPQAKKSFAINVNIVQ